MDWNLGGRYLLTGKLEHCYQKNWGMHGKWWSSNHNTLHATSLGFQSAQKCNKTLCRCNWLKDLETGTLSWIIQAVPKGNHKSPFKIEAEENYIQKRREQCNYTGRDWSDVFTAKECYQLPEAGGCKYWPLEPPRGQPCGHLTFSSGKLRKNSESIIFCCFKLLNL